MISQSLYKLHCNIKDLHSISFHSLMIQPTPVNTRMAIHQRPNEINNKMLVAFNPNQSKLIQQLFLVNLPMHYALSPSGIWKLRICQSDDRGSHFLKPELFQMEIFGCYLLCSFTFNLYLGMSWKQISAAVKLPKNQLQFKKAANQIEGTSWPEPLKNESK